MSVDVIRINPNGHEEDTHIFAAFAGKTCQWRELFMAGLIAYIGVPLKVLVNEPEGGDRRNQGKGPSDDPPHLYKESAEDRRETERRFTW